MTAQRYRRGQFKLFFLIALVAMILAALIWGLDERALDNLKYNLDFWTIMILLLIINLVSFLCFIIMYACYRWVKKDLSPEDHNQQSATRYSKDHLQD